MAATQPPIYVVVLGEIYLMPSTAVCLERWKAADTTIEN
jgi:hypothetical protein